jgi:hypothetical protein
MARIVPYVPDRMNNLNLRCTTLCLPSGFGTPGLFQEAVQVFGRGPLAQRALDSAVATRSSAIRFTQPLQLLRISRGYGNGAQ